MSQVLKPTPMIRQRYYVCLPVVVEDHAHVPIAGDLPDDRHFMRVEVWAEDPLAAISVAEEALQDFLHAQEEPSPPDSRGF